MLELSRSSSSCINDVEKLLTNQDSEELFSDGDSCEEIFSKILLGGEKSFGKSQRNFEHSIQKRSNCYARSRREST